MAGTAIPVKDQILTVILMPVMKMMMTKMIMIWKTVMTWKRITMKAVMACAGRAADISRMKTMKAIMECGVIISRKIMTTMKITGNMVTSMASQADSQETLDNLEVNMASLVDNQEAMVEVNMASLMDNQETMVNLVDNRGNMAGDNIASLMDNQEATVNGQINMVNQEINQEINLEMKEAVHHAVEEGASVADMANNLHKAIMAPAVMAATVAIAAPIKIQEGHLAATTTQEEVIVEENGIPAQEIQDLNHRECMVKEAALHKVEARALTGALGLLQKMTPLITADLIQAVEIL
jgi:hypothetical protein